MITEYLARLENIFAPIRKKTTNYSTQNKMFNDKQGVLKLFFEFDLKIKFTYAEVIDSEKNQVYSYFYELLNTEGEQIIRIDSSAIENKVSDTLEQKNDLLRIDKCTNKAEILCNIILGLI